MIALSSFKALLILVSGVAGLTAKILDVKTLPDVYGAFYDFTGLISAKVSFLCEFCNTVSVRNFFVHDLLVHWS